MPLGSAAEPFQLRRALAREPAQMLHVALEHLGDLVPQRPQPKGEVRVLAVEQFHVAVKQAVPFDYLPGHAQARAFDVFDGASARCASARAVQMSKELLGPGRGQARIGLERIEQGHVPVRAEHHVVVHNDDVTAPGARDHAVVRHDEAGVPVGLMKHET